ncbi:MAG: hypothetical protein IPG11_12905 [Flavobacteriales bacterium]|nr:hypothetical protein [Flavobacteriales bacterium]
MNISKQGNPSPNVKTISAFFVACVTYCQCQTFCGQRFLVPSAARYAGHSNDSDRLGGYVVRPDTDRCVVNYRSAWSVHA